MTSTAQYSLASSWSYNTYQQPNGKLLVLDFNHNARPMRLLSYLGARIALTTLLLVLAASCRGEDLPSAENAGERSMPRSGMEAQSAVRLGAQNYYQSEAAKGSGSSPSGCEMRCIADAFIPAEKNFPSVIFFHGGAMKEGGPQRVPEYEARGWAVFSPTYRFYPKTHPKEILRDAAQSVAWAFARIKEHGGDTKRVALGGFSAGGYLALQLVMDPSYLEEVGLSVDQIAAVVSYSGHTITHMTVREAQGIPATQPVIDAYAPAYHVRPNTPPILLMTGDRELELNGRYEENAYFWRMMKVVDHADIKLIELKGFGHDISQPGHKPALSFLEKRFSSKLSTLTASGES